jgi:tetratricopeptide (TPR) repeat protein
LVLRGFARHVLGMPNEALADFERAATSKEVSQEAHYGRAVALAALGRFDEAVVATDCVLRAAPQHPSALKVKGIALRQLGQWENALACYESAMRTAPSDGELRSHRSLALLAMGDYTHGFREYEYRLSLWHSRSDRRGVGVQWRGESPLTGKTLLLTYEQGLGDAIQFARYIPGLAQLAGRVVVQVPSALVTLFQTLDGQPQVIPESDPIPAHDLQCPINSLPYVCGCVLSQLPGAVNYLRVPAYAAKLWAGRHEGRRRLRIALAWRGRNYFGFPDPRAIDVAMLGPLFDVDADFVVIQPDVRPDEHMLLSQWPHVLALGPQLTDLAQVAAVIDQVDLVITVDTSFAHLGGAMAKSTWVLSRYACCWRWLIGRSDSPWYPSVTLFRQSQEGDWAAVVTAVKDALAARRGIDSDSD